MASLRAVCGGDQHRVSDRSTVWVHLLLPPASTCLNTGVCVCVTVYMCFVCTWIWVSFVYPQSIPSGWKVYLLCSCVSSWQEICIIRNHGSHIFTLCLYRFSCSVTKYLLFAHANICLLHYRLLDNQLNRIMPRIEMTSLIIRHRELDTEVLLMLI